MPDTCLKTWETTDGVRHQCFHGTYRNEHRNGWHRCECGELETLSWAHTASVA